MKINIIYGRDANGSGKQTVDGNIKHNAVLGQNWQLGVGIISGCASVEAKM